MKFALLVTTSLLFAGSAMAQTIEMPAGAAAVVAKPSEGDTIVCRTEEVTGQRFKSRICHTKTQWAALGEYGRSVTEASQMGSSAHVCSGGAC